MSMAQPGRGTLAVLIAAVTAGLVLVRVGLIVLASLTVFLLSFFGYFVWPLVFVLIALGILGVSSTLRHYARLRARR